MKSKLFLLLFITGILYCLPAPLLNAITRLSRPEQTIHLPVSICLDSECQIQKEEENKSLWDLSADAQSQFIKIFNTRYPENEQFLEAMSFEYLKEDKPLFPYGYVSKDLRLVFSISKQRDYG